MKREMEEDGRKGEGMEKRKWRRGNKRKMKDGERGGRGKKELEERERKQLRERKLSVHKCKEMFGNVPFPGLPLLMHESSKGSES